MANDTTNKIQSDKPVPDYLSFDELRNEGIDYLGRITGKLWTDFNVHDPGITILEALCYALLDLDYRIKLPPEDIFARHPLDTGPDDNFYSPAEMLGNNPLTIVDYRKLLLDIDGVKNAWLEVAHGEHDPCVQDKCIPFKWRDKLDNIQDELNCSLFLNGLYHVYIELEKGQDEKEILCRVKKTLMAYRNLCEDFCNIYVLCPLETGVCADIELDVTADVAQVYVDLINKLSNFFSPSPHFYTLQQLLDRGRTIDEIFEGRPCCITKSHGFIDKQELQAIPLRKEIHLSDVYNAIFEVNGIKTIRNLQLNICNGNNPGIKAGWKYNIPENYIPEFFPACSGFRFTRNGKQLGIDTTKYNSLFEISQNKVLYKKAVPNLDAAYPNGLYRSDLDDYYSVQNDFPNVYGISKGGLPPDAPDLRKASALQLKGYLLFFDQLLANYLEQLKNIRSLFSMTSPATGTGKTYFLNFLANGDQPEQPNFCPDVKKLWRLYVDDDLAAIIGNPGNTLVFPVSKKEINKLITHGKLSEKLPGDLAAFEYEMWEDIQDVISLLKTDFSFEEDIVCQYIQHKTGCWYYYIISSSDEIILVSKKTFLDKEDAQQHAAYVLSCARYDQNYSVFSIPIGHYTFTIDISGASVAQYLQSIMEDQDGYIARREQFLDHLLSRFAEKFTDYALLLYKSSGNTANVLKDINAKEKFLSNYPDLSCNRGKGYDYWLDNWNNNNISGFEKKVKALSGMPNWQKHNLCHFVVAKYEEQYILTLVVAQRELFTFTEKFNSVEEAEQAATSLIKALCNRPSYGIQHISHERSYAIVVSYRQEESAMFVNRYESAQQAEKICDHLYYTFRQAPSRGDIFISSYVYKLQLKDSSGKTCKTSVNVFHSREEAIEIASKAVKSINQGNKWETADGMKNSIGSLYQDKKDIAALRFVDTKAFKIDINDTIINKPDKFTYELLNNTNAFKFIPVEDFDNHKSARNHALDLLFIAADKFNYVIETESATGKYMLCLYSEERKQATSHIEYHSYDEAARDAVRIREFVLQQLYNIFIEEEPDRWKFQYYLGYEDHNRYRFVSNQDFESMDASLSALVNFIKEIPSMDLVAVPGIWTLHSKKAGANLSSASTLPAGNETKQGDPKSLLELQKAIDIAVDKQNPNDFTEIKMDALSQKGQYVYQLVDKEKQLAFCTIDYKTALDAEIGRKNLIGLLKQGVWFLEICLDGDIVKTRKDECGQILYHYLIKSRNEYASSAEPFILFESVAGYISYDEAIVAFKNNYLKIIDWASDMANYGKVISLTEKYLSPDNNELKQNHDVPVVFVPVQTKLEIGGTDIQVISKLVSMAVSYPIRILEFGSDLFCKLFCIEKDPVIPVCDVGVKHVYYYRLIIPDPSSGSFQWQSIFYYQDELACREAYSFFLVLLKYTGNLYVDCYCCDKVDEFCNQDTRSSYRIYIREVLVESVDRFLTKVDAWGAKGIEKFICAEQTGCGLHAYQRADDCCYSFFVACGEPVIIHPCLYDTAEKRNIAKENLYRSFIESYKKGAYDLQLDKQGWLLKDGNGEPFARIPQQYEKNNSWEIIFDLFADVSKGILKFREMEGFIEGVGQSGMIVQSHNSGQTIGSLKDRLEEFVCHFPLVRKEDGNFAIEMKLPGFNSCGQNKILNEPCNDEDPVIPEAPCYIAWKGRCIYNSPLEAKNDLEKAKSILSQYSHYQSSFECDCHSFGIKLAYGGELIALNPQCYPFREMACEAIQRADAAVNDEGLHLVEHILLRPFCGEKDCECRSILYCPESPDCSYPWKVPNTDPCMAEKNICFIPGVDPYSFIATVVLPAWPKMFRDPEKRLVIENIIYQEAPAHVLLRILWLAPKDFCLFETKFKQWNRWLANKKDCNNDFSICSFLELLFKTEFECLPPCSDCQPCTAPPPLRVVCPQNDTVAKEDTGQQFTNQIDELFCWTQMDCEPEKTKDEIESDEVTTPVGLPTKLTHEEPAVVNPALPKIKLVNSRISRHRNLVHKLPEIIKDNPLVGRVLAFLKEPDPAPEKLEAVMAQVLKNKKPQKPGRALNNKELQVISQSIISYYIDKNIFNGKSRDKLARLVELRKKMQKIGINVKGLYEYWNAQEVKAYEPEADTELIKHMLTGNA